MKFTINSYITAQAAARLLITGDLDLFTKWSHEQSKSVLDEILNIKVDDLISIIDASRKTMPSEIDSSNIPQFGKVDTILRVPKVMLEENATNIDYVQMGFLLKKDPYASVQANQKYGENHGKIAAQLGLINCVEKRFVPSTITDAFVKGYSEEEQLRIVTRLFVRIPLVKILLQQSRKNIINGYDYMVELTSSTKERRGSSVRAILETVKCEDSVVMKERLSNISWKK